MPAAPPPPGRTPSRPEGRGTGERARGRAAAGIVVALASTAVLVLLLVVFAAPGAALGETVAMAPGSTDAVEGRAVTIHLTAGINVDGATEPTETLRVSCSVCARSYDLVVDFAQFPCAQGACDVTFPGRFRVTPGPGQSLGSQPLASSFSEPNRLDTYDVRVITGEAATARTTFDTWLTSAHSCRDGEALRSDILLVQTAGHEVGDTITASVRDTDRQLTVMEEERAILPHGQIQQFGWEIPLDYPLGGDRESRFVATVDSPKGREEETFVLRPGVAQPLIFRQPGGGGLPVDFERTEKVDVLVAYRFTSAPPGCVDMSPDRRVILVGPDSVNLGKLRVRSDKIRSVQPGAPGVVEPGPFTDGRFDAARRSWLVNYTIPKNAELTTTAPAPDPNEPTGPPEEEEVGPRYRFFFQRQVLVDGNYLPPFNTTSYIVHPYETTPAIAFRPSEVERLETARLVLNITYGDRSPVTDADNRTPIQVDFRHTGGAAEHQLEAQYIGNGRWKAEMTLSRDYLPLGRYEFVVHDFEDKWGNFFTGFVTAALDVVGARPVLTTTFLVDNEETDTVERTQTVVVAVHAVYKDGIPLTATNVDPRLGGIVLNVRKTNEAGTVTGIQRLLMNPAGNTGDWVKAFRVEADATNAPPGTWAVEVVARDGRDPPNENVTSFPLVVLPAQLSVTTVVQPPGEQHANGLVREGVIDYRFRILYPDRTLVTAATADPARGGRVTVQLERLGFIRTDRIVADVLRGEPSRTGDLWSVRRNATTPDGLPALVEGTYVFNVTARDIHGNVLEPFITRPFLVFFGAEFRNATNPLQKAYERGSTIVVAFPGIAGDLGPDARPGTHPLLRLYHRSVVTGRFEPIPEDLRLTREEAVAAGIPDPGDNHVGVFQTGPNTLRGEYLFFFQGKSSVGRTIVGVSTPFNITATTVSRAVLIPFPATVGKGDRAEAVLQASPGDATIRVSLLTEEKTVGAGSGQLRPDGMHIVVRPPPTTPSGPVTVFVEGRDLFGNVWNITLGPFIVTSIGIEFDPRLQPPATVARGATAEHTFLLQYPDGQQLLPSTGRPTVRIVDVQNAVVGEATVTFDNGVWLARWTPPPETPLGSYRFEVGGSDLGGNDIGPRYSVPFDVTPGEVLLRVVSDADDIVRGRTATATFEAPTPVRNLTWEVGTVSEVEATPTVLEQGSRFVVTYATGPETPQARLRFSAAGEDVYGNTLRGRSGDFRVGPMSLTVAFTKTPEPSPTAGDTVTARFVVRYPDGTVMGRQVGVPIVTVAYEQRVMGTLAGVLNPQINEWVVSWETPKEPERGPYRFVVGGKDNFGNDITPGTAPAFYVVQPLVPDFFPTPPPSPVLFVALAAAAALVWRPVRRRD